MSEWELRQVLRDIIDDIDEGRLVPWRGRKLRRMVAGSALAAGLVLGGCGVPAYGVPVNPDARPDTGATDAYGIPMMDARPDTGATDAYGIPMMDADIDAEITGDASVSVDDGGVFLYGVPPSPEDDFDDPQG